MASLVATVVDGYNNIWELRGKPHVLKLNMSKREAGRVKGTIKILKISKTFPTDRRVENWLFMSSPLSTLAICLSYVMIVKVWGPAFMKNRPAFQFRRTLVIYNAIQVLFSTWLFYEVMSITIYQLE